MADTRDARLQGSATNDLLNSRTPGPLGIRDQADPNSAAAVGDMPGPAGVGYSSSKRVNSIVWSSLRDLPIPSWSLDFPFQDQYKLEYRPDGIKLKHPLKAVRNAACAPTSAAMLMRGYGLGKQSCTNDEALYLFEEFGTSLEKGSDKQKVRSKLSELYWCPTEYIDGHRNQEGLWYRIVSELLANRAVIFRSASILTSAGHYVLVTGFEITWDSGTKRYLKTLITNDPYKGASFRHDYDKAAKVDPGVFVLYPHKPREMSPFANRA